MSGHEAVAGESILLEVALQFGSTLDLDLLVPLVLERIVTLLRAERAFFAILDDRQEIEHAVTHNLSWAGPPHPLPASMGAVAQVIERRQPVTTALGPNATESVRLYGLNFVVAVPVMVRQRLVGVLYVDSKVSGRQDIESLRETLLAIASLAGVAVENARLFDEQRFRRRLLARMVHDFRNPLTSVRACGEALQPEEADEFRQMGNDLVECSDRIVRMIDSTLALSRIEEGGTVPTLAPVRVDEVVQAHARALALVARGMGLSIAVTVEANLPTALTILDRVEVAIDNVLFNALKYGARGSVVMVSVASRADAGPEDGRGRQRTESRFMFDHVHTFAAAPGERFLEVSVHNLGRPIPDHVRHRLFSPYVRGDEARGAHTSTGLGLSIVAECVRSLGGRVWLAGSDDTGTRFCFTVPLRSTRDA